MVKQLSERLAAMGHAVMVATRKHPDRTFSELNGVKVISFDIEGNLVNGIKGSDVKAYEALLLDNDFDVITFFAAQQWATDLALPLLRQIRARKVSVPTGYSGLYWPGYEPYFEKMKTWILDYDMNVYLSDDYRDINFARANGVTKTILIPNGASAGEFLPPPSQNVRSMLNMGKGDFLILHVGSFTGWKGHLDAVRIFLRSDMRNATLLMIGNNHAAFRRQSLRKPWLVLRMWYNRLVYNKRVVAAFYPREVTVDAYKESDLFLFPSNIECSPIVLFECAASRLPFMATRVGNSEEIASWTGGGVIMPTRVDEKGFSHAEIKGSAELLDRLHHDAILRKRMGDEAFAAWQEKYSWEAIAKEYEKMYLSLLQQ